MSRYIFIRHGESTANREGWLSGHADVPLTERGERQAIEAAPALGEYQVKWAFSSDLRRAARTAELLLLDSPLQARPSRALRERSCGSDQGDSLRTVEESGRIQQYYTLDGYPPQGESLRAVAIRAMGFLAEHETPGDCTLVVAHGGLIRVVVGLIDELPPAEFCRWKPQNCELIVRELASGYWVTMRQHLIDHQPTRSQAHGPG